MMDGAESRTEGTFPRHPAMLLEAGDRIRRSLLGGSLYLRIGVSYMASQIPTNRL